MQSFAATVMKSTTACWFILEILGFCLSLQLCNLGCGSSGGGASDLLNQRMLTGFLCSGPAFFIILAGSKVTQFAWQVLALWQLREKVQNWKALISFEYKKAKMRLF
jgi:hypothetical protein